MPKFDVIVVGDYFIDMIFTGLPQFPELGKEIYGSGFAMLPGGAYNTVAAMHRLGLNVGWAGDFGSDEFSQFVLNQARKEGLSEALFVRHHQPMRRITVAASFPGDRAFMTFTDPGPRVPGAIKALALSFAKAVYLPGLYYGGWFEAGLSMIRARGMKLIMDGNSSEETLESQPQVLKALHSVDLFMPNASEARRLTGLADVGEAAHALSRLIPLVVVKDGANGAYSCQHGKLLHMPAISVTPLDTTGAGDSFNAGFVRAWLDEKPLEDCLRWGNIVGGLSTLGIGGSAKVIREKDIQKWIRDHPD